MTAETMRAFRILEWQRPPELVEVDVPVPGPGQVLVRVAGNGLCHSDLAMMQMPRDVAEPMGWHLPFTLGHEVGGHVAALGSGVRGLREGDPVATMSPSSCGTCDYCVRGHDNCCDAGAAGRGYGRDGGLADYVLVDSARAILPLRTLDPTVAGVLTDAGATSYHAVRRVLPRLRPGSTAVVIGAGGLGSYAVQYLRLLSPATVVAVDSSPARRSFAEELGAHTVLDGVDADTTAQLRELTGGAGADAVLDFVGIDATIEAGVAAVRKVGAYALVGAAGGRLPLPMHFTLPRDGDVFTFQGPTIADTREVLALAESGRLRIEVERFPLERVTDAYDALHHGRLRGRAVVVPG